MSFTKNEKSKKVCLLGGSNSLISHGIRRGLAERAHVMNLALGMSSSLQNTFSLVRFREKIISEADAIVTESNVNDAYNIHSVGMPSTLTISNIYKMYRELSLMGKHVIVLIIPTKTYHKNIAPPDLVSNINKVHLECAVKYGFDVINLEKKLTKYTPEAEYTRIIMPDAVHPIDSYMHQLGLNIADYLSNISQSDLQSAPASSSYDIYDIGGLTDTRNNKKNSIFSEATTEINHPVEIDISNGKLVGIGTWSDGPSELRITHPGGITIKQFNELCAFNELLEDVSGKIVMESSIGKSRGRTEPSVNVSNYSSLTNTVNLVGLLIERNTPTPAMELNESSGTNLEFLIPDETVHIIAVRRYLIKNEKRAKGRRTKWARISKPIKHFFSRSSGKSR